MTSKKEQHIISKEDAVFWMDENGIWCNEYGRFEHPKVIRYFNASIRKDAQGYFVSQDTGDFEEKVYFRYVETAIFVVDIKTIDGTVMLILNNMEKTGFDSGHFFSRNDQLYLDTPEHLIKFSSQSLIKLSRYMQDDAGRLVLNVNGLVYKVEEKD